MCNRALEVAGRQDMAQSPQTITAFIAAAASLIVALISYLGKRKSDRELAQLNAELIETQERLRI